MTEAPISFANVELLTVRDTMPIGGVSTDEMGYFEILGVLTGSYFVRASYIENKSELILVVVTENVNLDPIRLADNAQSLEEVVVTARKPRLERKVDRLVFNIENTAMADGDIWDVLKRTPSVIIINNKLTVKGSDAVGILINDRPVNLPKDDILNLLSGTSASDVQAIEIITNPPANYSAEQGVLINIKMKRNLVAGYNGALYNKYTQGVLPKHMVGTDHYFKGKKTGLSVNYNFTHNREITRYTDITNFFNPDGTMSKWVAEQDYLRQRKRHNISAFFDYDLDERNRLSLSTITIWQPFVDREYDTETDISGDASILDFNTLNRSEERRLNTSYYVDYERQLNGKGETLSFNGHYTFFDYSNGQNLETDFFDQNRNVAAENDFTTDSEQFINLFSLQADFSSPLNETSALETGLRYAGSRSKSIIIQEGFDREQPGIEPTRAGKFNYDESIFATYASFKAKWNLWRLNTGLRAEYTETLGRWSAGNQNNENDYFNLFPSFSLQYTPNERHDFNLYYYRRINRPRYESINPFQVFQNNFSTIEGDPNLVPATRHYAAAGYTLNSHYTLELFYRNEINGLQELIFQNNDTKLLRFIHSNMERAVSYGVDLMLNKDFTRFWNCYLLASFAEETNRFKNLGTDQTVENGLFSWFVKTTNGFTLLNDKSLTADVSFMYFGPQVSANSTYDGFGALSVLFRKTLWNNNASISIGLDDIFNQGNQLSTRKYLDQNSTSLRRVENRLFMLGFRYKFGNVGIRDNQKSKQIDERDRL